MCSVVVGGMGVVEGIIVRTLVFFGLRELLADFGTWYLILWGAVAVVVMLKAPQGIWGLAVQRFDLHLFPVRRRVVFEPAQGPRMGSPAVDRENAPAR